MHHLLQIFLIVQLNILKQKVYLRSTYWSVKVITLCKTLIPMFIFAMQLLFLEFMVDCCFLHSFFVLFFFVFNLMIIFPQYRQSLKVDVDT